MRRIADDIDRLMWTVAEGGDPRAVADFEARFPDLRAELAKRVQLVSNLKRARGAGAKLTVPPLRLGLSGSTLSVSRFRVVGGGLALAALAAASYVVTSSYLSQRAEPVAAVPAHITQPAPQVDTNPAQTPGGPPKVVYSNGSQSSNNEPSPQAPVQQQPISVPAYEKPQTIRMDHVDLLTALDAIAQQCGLRLTVAPGMPNPDIQVDSTGQTGLQVIQSLGKTYGFTAFDQGNGVVLIIPATEDSSSSGKPGEVNKNDPLRDRSNLTQ